MLMYLTYLHAFMFLVHEFGCKYFIVEMGLMTSLAYFVVNRINLFLTSQMRKMKAGANRQKHVTIPIIFVVDLLFSVIVRLLSQLKFPRWHDCLIVVDYRHF